MGNATAFLKKKGPLGMPMAFWVGFVAIGGYLGYRWWSNRSGSSSSSSSTDTGGGVTDGATTDTIPGGEIDTTEPPTSTVPGTKDTTGDLGTSTGTGETVPDTGGNKTKHKKKHPKKRVHHATPHDHKQGTHHTDRKRLPKPGSPHRHAPLTEKRPHSRDKAEVTRNVRKSPQVRSEPIKGYRASPAVIAKTRVPKSLPAAPKREEHEKKTHKAPPQKRTRVR